MRSTFAASAALQIRWWTKRLAAQTSEYIQTWKQNHLRYIGRHLQSLSVFAKYASLALSRIKNDELAHRLLRGWQVAATLQRSNAARDAIHGMQQRRLRLQLEETNRRHHAQLCISMQLLVHAVLNAVGKAMMGIRQCLQFWKDRCSRCALSLLVYRSQKGGLFLLHRVTASIRREAFVVLLHLWKDACSHAACDDENNCCNLSTLTPIVSEQARSALINEQEMVVHVNQTADNPLTFQQLSADHMSSKDLKDNNTEHNLFAGTKRLLEEARHARRKDIVSRYRVSKSTSWQGERLEKEKRQEETEGER